MTLDYTLAFDPMLPLGILLAFAIAFTLLLLFTLRGNAAKASARFAFACLLLLFLAQPQLIKENRKSLDDVALIAVDKSLSENFGNRKTTSASALERLQAELKKISGLETRTIDVAIRASDETKVFETIETSLADVPESQRAGVILLTDGQVTDAPSKDLLKSAPLNVILTGSKRDKDREIKIINAPGYSVLGESVSLKFRIEDHNISSGNIVSVTLNKPDGTTETRSVPVNTDQDWPLTITNAGQNIFELSTPPVTDEISVLNNRAVINVQGVRNRLRVLLVSGEPYPGARMWRDLLKADPGVDLVHFTILRSPEKIDMTPPNELSLIAFPFQELFERKLKNFDLIIMDRFSLTTALPDYYFQNMMNYVRQGGALLEISGPSYATDTSLHFTSLGSVLPGLPDGSILRQEFKPAITETGKTHPVTMPLLSAPSWGPWLQQLPMQPKFGEVLMTGIDGRPLLILAHVNDGRVAQLASDQMWLWSRGYKGGGPTKELLRRTVHWLMKEPELDETAMKIQTTGKDINIRMREGDDNSPLEVSDPYNKIETITLSKGEDGWLSANIPDAKDGIYKFKSGERTKIVAIGDTTTPEFSNIIATDKNLRPSVLSSKGSLIWAEERNNFIPRLKRNESSSLVSTEAKPLLPPEIMSGLALLAGLLLWWLESRKKRKTASV